MAMLCTTDLGSHIDDVPPPEPPGPVATTTNEDENPSKKSLRAVGKFVLAGAMADAGDKLLSEAGYNALL